jgi:hypothetical protein
MAATSKRTVRTSVLLSDTQYAEIAALAAERDLSVAWVIRQAVQDYLVRSDRRQLVLPIASKNSDK